MSGVVPVRPVWHSRHRDIGFPYRTVKVPECVMNNSWTREQYIDYLATWSAVKECRVQSGRDPIITMRDALVPVWPDNSPRDISWPLTLLAGYRQR